MTSRKLYTGPAPLGALGIASSRGLIAKALILSCAIMGILLLPSASALAAGPYEQVLESASFSEAGKFEWPSGVAIDQANGNVFVVNSEAKAVDIFGAEGGAPAGGGPSAITGVEVEVFEPQGIAVDESGDVYLVEWAAHKVVKYKYESGTKTYSAAELVHKGSTAYEPNGVALGPEGNVYIAAYNEAETIKAYTPAGLEVAEILVASVTDPEYVAAGGLSAFGGPILYVAETGPGPTEKVELNSGYEVEEEVALAGARGGAVAVDSEGNAFVDEGSKIAEYSATGVRGEEFGEGYFEESQGVAVNDTSGYVYVTAPVEVPLGGNLVVFAQPVSPPVNEVLPTITGTPKDGKTLTASTGTWENGPTSYEYEWKDCEVANENNCTEIEKGSNNEYTLTEADVGSTVRVKVFAENAGGTGEATSAPTAEVEAEGALEATKTGEVFGEVPITTTLASACGTVYLGEFLPGVAEEYNKTCFLTVTATGEENTLTATDESATHTGHLVQGRYFLKSALETKGTDTESLGGSGGSPEPLTSAVTLLTYETPVSADNVEVEFNQPIGQHDPLHSGTYAKTITLTLLQTKP
jgi:SMP-30/Gluconolactonase/LRE-like region